MAKVTSRKQKDLKKKAVAASAGAALKKVAVAKRAAPVKKAAARGGALKKKGAAVKAVAVKKAVKRAAPKKKVKKRAARRRISAADEKRMRVARLFWGGEKPIDAYRQVYPAAVRWKAENAATEAYRTLQSEAARGELERLRKADELFAVASHEEVLRFNTQVLRGVTRQVLEEVLDAQGQKQGERLRAPTIIERQRAGREILKYALPASDGGDGAGADEPEVVVTLDERLEALKKKLGG